MLGAGTVICEPYWTYGEQITGAPATTQMGSILKSPKKISPDVATRFSLVGLPPSGDMFLVLCSFFVKNLRYPSDNRTFTSIDAEASLYIFSVSTLYL